MLRLMWWLGTFQQALLPYVNKCHNTTSFPDPESTLLTGAKSGCLRMYITLFWGRANFRDLFKCMKTED